MRPIHTLAAAAGLFLIVTALSGCALLSVPGQIVSGVVDVVGKGVSAAAGAASSVPTPPPWVFL